MKLEVQSKRFDITHCARATLLPRLGITMPCMGAPCGPPPAHTNGLFLERVEVTVAIAVAITIEPLTHDAMHAIWSKSTILQTSLIATAMSCCMWIVACSREPTPT